MVRLDMGEGLENALCHLISSQLQKDQHVCGCVCNEFV